MFSDPVEIKKARRYEEMYEKISQADKMFEELGYKKEKYDKGIMFYMPIQNFDDKTQAIKFYNDKTIIKHSDNFQAEDITMQELKAINMKCKELGWSDE